MKGILLLNRVQGFTLMNSGLVNFIPAVGYHFYLNLPAAFSQPGNSVIVKPCMFGDVLAHLPARRGVHLSAKGRYKNDVRRGREDSKQRMTENRGMVVKESIHQYELFFWRDRGQEI